MKIRQYRLDNPIMRLAVFLLVLSTALYAETETDFSQEARPMPALVPQHAESDEIDQEIKRYFEHATSGMDTDQKRLDRIFMNNEAQTRPGEDEGSFTFHELGNKDETYRVKAKDTIYSISKKFGVKPQDIIKQNPDLETRALYIDEEIVIRSAKKPGPVPGTSVQPTYLVQKGDNLSLIARKYRTTPAVLMKINGLGPASALKTGMSLRLPGPPLLYRSMFAWPVQAPITSYFGRRYNPFLGGFPQFHKGLDLGAQLGTQFHAARDGIVIYSGRMEGYGNVIFVRHVGGLVTVYGHNKLNLVKQGDIVRQGQVIGQVGRTGSATGPHLHFEVRKQELALNPLVALGWKEVVPPGQVAEAR
ncbi:MAG TPA: M23 family metallopeptidase [Leptospiraceae bacterium]|nr:M23 family metallopeptidase [Leptospirales bacterium]HMX58624.1 M23 family metallopeptidase [Leptospiraceae bacterium]HMY44938.1 M23 family metallopeptidase [Leptospiraceae bacterium]HNJ33659.1 M23 family metallopeptidase [Leptospiraceae bacterium]HNL68656.1 M23 family metallopeptidase [Leptospiraceae bacterium]